MRRALLLVLALATTAKANPADTYGFGSRSTAMGGAVSASARDFSANYYNPSGLALARGILAARDSDIILMDEPTSSVDPKTEVEIYQRLFKEFQGKAMVSSLHRLHLLNQFDYIYILDQGRVVDEGAFESLRANSPAFQALWRHQEESVAG